MKSIKSILFLALVGFVLTGCEKSESYADADDHTMPEMTENEMLAEALESNTAAFHAALDGLSEEQLAYQESDDRWSIAGVAEHIAVAHGAMYEMLAGVLEGEPVATRPDSMMTDDQIYAMITDRSTAFQAPDPFQPSGRFESMDDLVAAFDAAQGNLTDVLKSDKNLRNYYGAHPAGIEMDAYQWVKFIMGHAERHLAQIQQVKDHAGYPSS